MENIKILLLENIHPIAKQRLESEGFVVDLKSYAPEENELLELVKKYNVIGIRSKTEITDKVLQSGSHLLSLGCFCIGTNQVNLGSANSHGIPVFNAPYSNTRSVAELVICEMISWAKPAQTCSPL